MENGQWRRRLLVACGLTLMSCLSLLIQRISPGLADDKPLGENIASEISNQYSTATVFLFIRGKRAKDGAEVKKYGTGFVISDEGFVLTSAHLLEDDEGTPLIQTRVVGSLGSSFDIEYPTGLILALQEVKLDTEADAGLLQFPHGAAQQYKSVHFCRGASARVGAHLHALGFPLQQPLTINSGTLTSKDGPHGLWKVDILVSEGSSGGPVFDDTGHVIGLVKGGIADAPGTNFIVPVNLFLGLIESGIASIDECSDSKENATLIQRLCVPKIVEYDIEFFKSDHPNFTPDVRVFKQSYSAVPGYTFEKVQWLSARQDKATDPEITINDTKTVVRFQTYVSSGPFNDTWPGLISGKLITLQKPAACD